MPQPKPVPRKPISSLLEELHGNLSTAQMHLDNALGQLNEKRALASTLASSAEHHISLAEELRKELDAAEKERMTKGYAPLDRTTKSNIEKRFEDTYKLREEFIRLSLKKR